MDTRDTPPTPAGRPGAAPNAYEAFWDCLEDGAPASPSPVAGDHRDAYRQFWDLTDGD
jgi:hypothetical protein